MMKKFMKITQTCTVLWFSLGAVWYWCLAFRKQMKLVSVLNLLRGHVFSFQHKSHRARITILQQANATDPFSDVECDRKSLGRATTFATSEMEQWNDTKGLSPLTTVVISLRAFSNYPPPSSTIEGFRFLSKRLTADNTENKSHRFLLQRYFHVWTCLFAERHIDPRRKALTSFQNRVVCSN